MLNGAPKTTKNLIEAAEFLHRLSFAETEDESEAFDRILSYAEGRRHYPVPLGALVQTDLQYFLRMSLVDPANEVLSYGLALWADCGFPKIDITQKFLASLMVTNVGKDFLQDIKMPFPSYLIEIPPEFIYCIDPESKPVEVRKILVLRSIGAKGRACWNYVAMTEGGTSLWRTHCTPELLLPANLDHNSYEGHPLLMPITSIDERAIAMIGRIIINSALAMSDPTCVKQQGPGHREWGNTTRRGRSSKKPLVRLFVLGKAVKHDFRPQVAEYMRSGVKTGNKLQHQYYVAGYWRRPPGGVAKGAAKTVHVEPYWKGPEDSPILVREHKV